MRLSFTIFDCAESALMVDFGTRYSKALSLTILDAGERLSRTGLPGLGECVPAFSSLTVFYDPLRLQKERLVAEIEVILNKDDGASYRARTFDIPVLYGGEGGPDLDEVAAHAGMTPGDAVSLHSAGFYHVYMLGFLPGFAYLGDLPEPLRLLRRSTPRTRVPAGSVAIAAAMTAVYPVESPGGWHLIGSTPVSLWDAAHAGEPLLKPGDRVRFLPVSGQEADRVRERVAAGWRPEPMEEG